MKQSSRMLDVERDLKLEAYENIKRLYSQLEQVEETNTGIDQSTRMSICSTSWNQRQRKLSQFSTVDHSAIRYYFTVNFWLSVKTFLF